MQSQRSLLRQFLRYVTATISSLMVFSLYTIADGLFVARGVGEYAMSAVNLAAPFTNFLFSLAVLFAVGASTVIAIYLGQGKAAEASRLFSQNLILLTILGLTVTVLVFSFLQPLAHLLGASGDTWSYTLSYLRGWAPFAACVILSYHLEILVKTDGCPQLALITVTIGCLFNCLMDYIAIFHLHWGVYGAALASGLSQLLTCVIYLAHFLRGKTSFHLVRFSPDWRIYGRLIPLGISDGITELCAGVMVFLFNRTVLRCTGQEGLVAYSIIAYVNTLVCNVLLGVSQGTQPLISYHYGKSDSAGCRKLLRCSTAAALILSVLAYIMLHHFAPSLVQAFLGTAVPSRNAYAAEVFRHYIFCYLLVGLNLLAAGFLTAVERPRLAIILSTGRGLVIQSLCLWILSLLSCDAIWFAPTVSEACCLVLSISFLRRFLRSQK